MKNYVCSLALVALSAAACRNEVPPPPTPPVAPQPTATPTPPPATTEVPAPPPARTTTVERQPARTPAPAPVPAPALVWAGNLDLVCEMKVKEGRCDTAHYHGKVYGFCSESCKTSFLENPAEYLGAEK